MKEEEIAIYRKKGNLRPINADLERAHRMIEKALKDGKYATTIPITDESAGAIVRELYASLLLIGDALWMRQGYEPKQHEPTINLISSLKEMYPGIDRIQLFFEMRNDATYRDYDVSKEDAANFKEFWLTYAHELAKH